MKGKIGASLRVIIRPPAWWKKRNKKQIRSACRNRQEAYSCGEPIVRLIKIKK